MPDEPVVQQQAGASAEPASASPAPKADETVSMSRAEFDAFVKAQTDPLQKKYGDLEAEHGRLKKRSTLSADDVARLTDSEKNFESVKRLVRTLGVAEDDIKDAESVRDLELLLRGYQRKADPATAKAEDADTLARFQAWQVEQAKAKAPAGSTTQRITPGGGNPAPATITDDDIDVAYLDGRLSADEYRKRLKR